MSLPSPPSILSSPLEPESVSLPAPPSSRSSPRMPRSRSSPPRPTKRSAPRVPSSVSGALGADEQRQAGLDDERARPAGDRQRAQPHGGGRGEDRERPARRVGDVETRAVGRPGGTAGTAAGRRAGDHAPSREVDERGLAVDAATQLGAGRHDRLRAVGRDAEAAATVGAELDRGRRCGRWTARSGRAARRRAACPCAASSRRPRRGPWLSRLTPAAPASLIRRTSRPEVRSSTATAPPAWTSIARVGVTTSSIGVPASLRSPVRCMLATSIDSIAPLRAAKTFVPSGETASASGVPVVRMLPAPSAGGEVDHRDRPARGDVGARPVRRGRHGARAAGQRDARRPRCCRACRAGRRSTYRSRRSRRAPARRPGASRRSVRPARSVRTKPTNTPIQAQSRSLYTIISGPGRSYGPPT